MTERLSKPKIAIIGTRGYNAVYSGFETWVREMCNGLKDKYEFHVYCHSNLVKDKPQIINGIHLHYFPAVETKFLAQYSHSLQATLHALTQPYDIYLYASTANAPFGLILKTFGKRTVVNVDGLDWLRPKWKGWGGRVFYRSALLATRCFDILISDAHAIADYYTKVFQADSITIAYGAHPVNPNVSANALPRGLQLNEYYLVVGRLIPDNHLLEIINGFKQSSSKRKLVIVGDLPYRDPYVDSVKREVDERVVLLGFVKDQDMLRSLYNGCYAYFHGHAFGGTNPSLLKALAYRCCVMAHDNVFNRETLYNEAYGLYFTEQPDNIAALLNRVDNDSTLVATMKDKAVQRIYEAYTWEKINAQYDALFQKMLSEPGWICNAKSFAGRHKSARD